MSFCSGLSARSTTQGSSFECPFQQRDLLSLSKQIPRPVFTKARYREVLPYSFSHLRVLENNLSALMSNVLKLLDFRSISSLLSRITALGIASLATLSTVRGLEPMGGLTFRINTDLAGDQKRPSVAALSNGGFVVAWEGAGIGGDSKDIYGRRYTASGAPLDSSAFRINTDLSGIQQNPSTAVLSDDSFVVTWESNGAGGNGDDIYGRRYTAAGAPLDSSALRINTDLTGDQRNPSVAALSSGGFVVAWEGAGAGGSNEVFGRRYNAAGAPLDSSAFRINIDLTGIQAKPSVAALPDGGFVVTWENRVTVFGVSNKIYGRRYNAAGAPVIAFSINSEVTVQYLLPCVAALSDGSFVMTWDGNGLGTVSNDIYGWRYSATSTPLDSTAFRINTDLAGIQTNPNLAVLSDDSFVVTWEGEDVEGDGNNIYGRRYKALGTPVDSSAFRINTDLEGNQASPRVASLSDGGFVVTWEGPGGGDLDIYGRIFPAQLIPSTTTGSSLATASENSSGRIETTQAFLIATTNGLPAVNLTSTTIPTTNQPTNPLYAGLAATITVVVCCILSALGLYLMYRCHLRRKVRSVNQANPQPTSSRELQTYATVPQRNESAAHQAYRQVELRENATSLGSFASSLPYATPQTWLDKEAAGAASTQTYDDAPPKRSGGAANQVHYQANPVQSNTSSDSYASPSSYATPQTWLDKETAGAAPSSLSQYNIPNDWRHA